MARELIKRNTPWTTADPAEQQDDRRDGQTGELSFVTSDAELHPREHDKKKAAHQFKVSSDTIIG